MSRRTKDPFAPRHKSLLGLEEPDTLPDDEMEWLDHLSAEHEFERWQKQQERTGAKPEVAEMRAKMLGLKDAFADGLEASKPSKPTKPSKASKASEAEDQELTTEQADFIRAYIRAGGITDTALVSTGITRVTLKKWQQQPAFQAAHAEAQQKWFEELRKAALLRAQAKSDVLLIFMLKALCPEVYDDNVRKARWMAQNGLVDNDNLPVRATLVRDSQTLVVHETQNTQVNILVDAANSRTVDPAAELANSQEWQDAFAVEQAPLAASLDATTAEASKPLYTAGSKKNNGNP